MKWTSTALLLLGLCLGCGQTEEPLASKAKQSDKKSTASRPSLVITEKTLADPLTNDEVQAFVHLVQMLPDQKPPQLAPVSSGAQVQGLRVDEAIVQWRKAVREALAVETLMQGWNPQTSIRRLMVEQRVPERSMLSLMLRLSCSISVDTMGGPRPVAAQRVLADEKIDQIVARISQLNRQGQPVPDSYWHSLEEACSLAEYLAILTEVPAENQSVVANHKANLMTMLPKPSNLGRPAATLEEDQIVPVQYESVSNMPPKPTRTPRSTQHSANR